MASKVNRWTIAVEDFFLLSRRYLRNLLTCAFWSAPLFSLRGCSRGAAPNRSSGSKSAGLSPGPAAGRPVGLRLRKSGVPHVGSSKRRDRAPKSGRSSVPARREGSRGARSSWSERTGIKPSRTGGQSKRRGREQWRTGASRDHRPQRAVARSTLGGARPWRASVRPCGSPARSAKLF